MSSLAQILQHVGLAVRLHAAMPVDLVDAIAHVQAATAAASPRVPAELLLAMAYVESRFDPVWVSRIEDGKRVHRRHPWTKPPRLVKRTSLYCGPLQTYAATWEACLRQRRLDVAYPAAVAELEAWLADRRVRGNLARALAGYGCGNHGVTTGRCNRYPARVLWQARRLGGSLGSHGPSGPRRRISSPQARARV